METTNLKTECNNTTDVISFFKASSNRHLNFDDLHYLAYVVCEEALKKDTKEVKKKQNTKTL
ncbi:MAG: hypothetical protein WC223_13800 [Bacteroidales bacterium]|jgi:hypothetical protein